VSDEQERFKPEAEDVEAHRGTLGLPAQDENESDEGDDEDVEAHRKGTGA